jgi:hypothetical protein
MTVTQDVDKDVDKAESRKRQYSYFTCWHTVVVAD